MSSVLFYFLPKNVPELPDIPRDDFAGLIASAKKELPSSKQEASSEQQ